MPHRLVSEIPAGPPGDEDVPREKRGNGNKWDTLALVR